VVTTSTCSLVDAFQTNILANFLQEKKIEEEEKSILSAVFEDMRNL
jgi:hypothetical protein